MTNRRWFEHLWPWSRFYKLRAEHGQTWARLMGIIHEIDPFYFLRKLAAADDMQESVGRNPPLSEAPKPEVWKIFPDSAWETDSQNPHWRGYTDRLRAKDRVYCPPPEDIKDLLHCRQANRPGRLGMDSTQHDIDILEAYRRGRRSVPTREEHR
jgi:hypothetical protein